MCAYSDVNSADKQILGCWLDIYVYPYNENYISETVVSEFQLYNC